MRKIVGMMIMGLFLLWNCSVFADDWTSVWWNSNTTVSYPNNIPPQYTMTQDSNQKDDRPTANVGEVDWESLSAQVSQPEKQ